jgi:hypothetical protein
MEKLNAPAPYFVESIFIGWYLDKNNFFQPLSTIQTFVLID